MKERTKVIVDDTTIYEVDLACYESLTPEEKIFSADMGRGKQNASEKQF